MFGCYECLRTLVNRDSWFGKYMEIYALLVLSLGGSTTVVLTAHFEIIPF